MGFTNFRANVLARAVILVALCLALVWSLLNTQWLATPVVCTTLVLLSAVELIRYVEKSSRELTSFLSFVAHHDYSSPVSIPYKGRVFSELESAYRVLTGEFRRLNLQKAVNHQYLEAVVEHVGVALCCLDDQGMVKMMNEPARRLFGVPHLNSVRTFARVDERLPELLTRLTDGERTLLSVRHGDDTLQLTLYATMFELLGQRYKLVSFQNIRDELDRQEIASWQKLIRVLTHEIMNSVTPIISLSRLIRETMIDDSRTPQVFRALLPQEQDDMLRSVTAIHSRSSGLLDFVQAYRSFAKLPPPVLTPLEVVPLLERVRTLLSQDHPHAVLQRGRPQHPGRRAADRAGAHKSAAQCRRSAGGDDRAAHRAARRAQRSGQRAAAGHRQRARYRARAPGQHLRAVLHHQAQRHRRGPERLAADHAGEPGIHLGALGARGGLRVHAPVQRLIPCDAKSTGASSIGCPCGVRSAA